MQTLRQLAAAARLGATVVSAGNFDGVHRAHQKVLQQMVARARALGAKAVAVTFDPHPLRLLRPQAAPKLITPLPEKLRLLAESGVDAALVIPFTRRFSRMPARDFAARVLRQGLHAVEVHEGANFRFGRQARGDVRQLAALGKQLGFATRIYPQLKLRGLVVSSNRIRSLLAAGDVKRARPLLGRPFSLRSRSAPGRGVGRKHTVPTINLAPYAELVPGNGVYITRTRVAGRCFDSLTNVGVRPTFGAASFAIESHLLGVERIRVAPGSAVQVFFLERLRAERKFPSPPALRRQIARDMARAQRYFHLEKLPPKLPAKPPAPAAG